MEKKILLLRIYFLISISSIFNIETSQLKKKYINSLSCIFGHSQNLEVVGSIYICEILETKFLVTQPETFFVISSSHNDSYKSDHDVFGVRINSKIVKYFPRGLENAFKNLKMIEMTNDKMKEIHQNDLKNFSKLKYLNLVDNKIETLEENLFAFNLKIELILLSGNRLRKIHESVFDNLENLNVLKLRRNFCISKSDEDRNDVLELIEEVKIKCGNNLEKSRIDRELIEVKNEVVTVKILDFIILFSIILIIIGFASYAAKKIIKLSKKSTRNSIESSVCVSELASPYNVFELPEMNGKKVEYSRKLECNVNSYEIPLEVEQNEYVEICQ